MVMKKLITLGNKSPQPFHTLVWPAGFPNLEEEPGDGNSSGEDESMDTISVNFLLRSSAMI